MVRRWGSRVDLRRVNFPCPNDELAEALRQIDSNLVVYTDKTVGIEDGRQISATCSRCLPTRRIDIKNRDFLASWEGSDNEWLLTEDKWAAEAFADDATED